MAAHALPSRRSALVLFSGGLDSTVTLYWARERYASVRAVGFFYGQTHSVELESAKAICKRARVPFETHSLTFPRSVPLTGPQDAKTLASRSKVFVPGRNLLFLAQMAQIAAIDGFGAILAGIDGNPLDPSVYPDTLVNTLLRLGDALDRGIYGEPDVTAYRFPLAGMTKAEILDEAQLLPGCWESLAYSHTCFAGTVPPCGMCSGCAGRIEGFFEQGSTDPLLERLQKTGEKAKRAKKAVKSGWRAK